MRAVGPSQPAAAGPSPAGEPSHHAFILTSMGLALTAGLMLATLVPLSIVLDWGWGGRFRPLMQAHGQVQVLGWVGLFIMGMAYRLMPRFSGRPLRFPPLAWASWPLLTLSLVLRLIGQLSGEGAWQGAVLVASGSLGVLAGASFAAVVFGTLADRRSRAEATGYFFLLGSAFFLAQAGLNLALVVQAAQRGADIVRPIYGSALLHLQFYGFISMFVLGVASRAVPAFSGLPRPEASAKVLALALAAVTIVFTVAALWVAAGTRDTALFRVEGASLAALGLVFLAGTWLVGVFRPAANRAAAASEHHIWFIRGAFAWLMIAAGLAGYYGIRASIDGSPPSAHGLDALRHAVGVGFASLMIAGMAMLVLPEFAIRRMRYPTERLPHLLILVLLTTATALRVGAAVATPRWPGPDRYWPMAAGGVLAEVAVLLFAAIFVWSMVHRGEIVASQIALRTKR